MLNTESVLMESLDQILHDTIIPGAGEVDRLGQYPEEGMRALAEAGILSIFSDSNSAGNMLLAVRIIEEIARHCVTTAVLVANHLVGALAITKFGPRHIQREIAQGRHITTLALHDQESSGVVWSALSTVVQVGGDLWMRGIKRRVAGGGHVDSYVWPAQALTDDTHVTLWMVPQNPESLEVLEFYVDAGVRGHSGATVAAEGLHLVHRDRLGDEGKGHAIMAGCILPTLDVLLASVQVGLMEAVTRRAASHCVALAARFGGGKLLDSITRSVSPHLASVNKRPVFLPDEGPDFRALLGRMRARTLMVRSHLHETAAEMDSHGESVTRATFSLKAMATEMANEVTAMALIIGEHVLDRGGTIERCYRDARSGYVHTFSPDTFYECVGRDECGQSLFQV